MDMEVRKSGHERKLGEKNLSAKISYRVLEKVDVEKFLRSEIKHKTNS
jgi:hypothetical protein